MLQFLFIMLFLALPAWAIIEAPVNPVDFEQNPNNIQWKKIDTENFEIIFPSEIAHEAQRAAHLLEKAYPFVTRSLETKPARISLVLQNQSVNSNGFVTLAPRRSEWYVTPSVDPELTNTEWLKTLSVHEFRHVVQFQKTRKNFNRYFEILLGEVGQALGLALTLPPWFLEGDAVGLETALTKGGRGRLPVFERDLRTLLLSGKDFDFDKAILRSYKDWVPNHYVYGYFLTTSMRNEYGDLFLSKLADQSSKTSWNPLSFYNSSDRMLEGNFEEFYAETMETLLANWKREAEKLTLTPYEVKTTDRPYGWTNYYFPMATSEGDVIALKSGLSYITQFVVLKGKKEELLFYPGRLIQEYPYKLRKDKFAYLEVELDPRWGYRDFSRLQVYDVKEKKIILTVPETKLRLATLNHEADKIMAVDWREEQGQSVVVMNSEGKELKRFPHPKEEVITSIDWISDDEAVLVIKDHDDMKVLASMNLGNGQVTYLTGKTVTNLGFVTVSEGNILLESPATGIDNIFHYQKNQLRQITSAPFGAYAPTMHEGKLIYNNYTVDGMDVVTKSVDWEKENISQDSFIPFYEKFAIAEGMDSFAQKLAEKSEHDVQDYSQVRNAINLHSWVIAAPPLSNTITLIGYSRDILNKFTLSGGAEYNLNETTGQGFVSAVWSHFYPVYDLRAAYGNRRQQIPVSNVKSVENAWEEGTLEGGVQIPWQNIVGRFNQSFTTRAFAKFIHVTDKVTTDLTDVSKGTLFSPGLEAHYAFIQRTALRDILPGLGFTLDGEFQEGHDIEGQDQKGSILSLDSRAFLPGLSKHHSFFHQFAYERQQDKFYQYSSLIFYPRGTEDLFLQEFTKYSGNYTLPLAYPDWHISRYIYMRRVAFNAFYDELRGRYKATHYQAASTGWELLLETNLLRLMLPLTWGLRGSYVLTGLEQGESNYELFIGSTLGVF